MRLRCKDYLTFCFSFWGRSFASGPPLGAFCPPDSLVCPLWQITGSVPWNPFEAHTGHKPYHLYRLERLEPSLSALAGLECLQRDTAACIPNRQFPIRRCYFWSVRRHPHPTVVEHWSPTLPRRLSRCNASHKRRTVTVSPQFRRRSSMTRVTTKAPYTMFAGRTSETVSQWIKTRDKMWSWACYWTMIM